MSKSRPPYPLEFREQMIALVRAGRSPESLSREFEPTAQTIHNWVRQADRDEGRRSDGVTSTEREELRRLRRENKRLRTEREILAKAAAWFARETDSVPPKSSSS
jgi:transposase